MVDGVDLRLRQRFRKQHRLVNVPLKLRVADGILSWSPAAGADLQTIEGPGLFSK